MPQREVPFINRYCEILLLRDSATLFSGYKEKIIRTH
ncbi:hypothetical protein Patl1_37667 [Pistacia atlantica]|nr:hypothetical protein Patl1_37667 [Pistacia atlantica]